jgi:hypothetical protein
MMPSAIAGKTWRSRLACFERMRPIISVTTGRVERHAASDEADARHRERALARRDVCECRGCRVGGCRLCSSPSRGERNFIFDPTSPSARHADSRTIWSVSPSNF